MSLRKYNPEMVFKFYYTLQNKCRPLKESDKNPVK